MSRPKDGKATPIQPYADQGLLNELINAAVMDHRKARRLLQQHPELLDARNRLGETALHFLVIENFIKGVEFLIKAGADVNATDQFGNSPLLHAERLENFEVATLLQANHAVRLEYFKTPMDLDDWV